MHEGLGVVQGTRGKSLRSQGLRVVHGASAISLRKGLIAEALVLFMVQVEKLVS